MHIVRCNCFDVKFSGKCIELGEHLQLFRNAVVLQLDIEILAEHAAQTQRERTSLLRLPVEQCLRDVACKAGGQTDQAFRMLCKEIIVNARLIVKSIHKCTGGKLDEVFISGFVLRK